VSTGWFGTRRHVIPVDDVRVESDEARDPYLVVPYAKEQMAEGPTFSREDDITTAHEQAIHAHYGRAGCWDDARRGAVRARQTTPAPTPEIAEAEAVGATDRDEDREAVRRWGA
jgi:hypothetical protein